LTIFVFYKNENIMASILLNYNTRNEQARKALDDILSSGFFEVRTIRKPCKKKSSINLVKTRSVQTKDPFAEVRGIWADRDVDARALRNEAWKIKND
jgi:hypothetical protein